MAKRGSDGWEDDVEVYSPVQVEGVLNFCDLDPVGDTQTHFLCFCPFHGNTDSPAFAVDKEFGLFHCFSPVCGVSGTLPELLRKTQGMNPFQALRTILKYKNHDVVPIDERLRAAMVVVPEFVAFPQGVLDRAYDDFSGSVAEQYMKSRGFDDETLSYFRVGYSAKQNMVIVPMHDPNGMPIGLIGRTPSSEDKRFKNSTNLPKSKTAWNFHRAKRHGNTVIICEASFDAMRIHQAGYPNVIALLGGHITQYHVEQINRHFDTVVIMTDFDHKVHRPNCRACNYERCQGHRPGRDLGRSIAAKLPHKRILWGAYDDTCVFPHDAKDASDMTDDEIRQSIKRAVSSYEYSQWNIE